MTPAIRAAVEALEAMKPATALAILRAELAASLGDVQVDARPVYLNVEEIAFVMTELSNDHDGSDFEPECPSCTAYKKLHLAAESRTAQNSAKDADGVPPSLESQGAKR